MKEERTPETRECGNCQACCTVLAINTEKVSKPAYAMCEHQCARGCAIYVNRPKPCAVYRCMWKLGWGPKNLRPDRLGLLVEAPGSGCGTFIKESKRGALKTKKGKKIFANLARQSLVFATPFMAPFATIFTGSREDLKTIVNNIAHLEGTMGNAARRFMLQKAGADASLLAKAGSETSIKKIADELAKEAVQ